MIAPSLPNVVAQSSSANDTEHDRDNDEIDARLLEPYAGGTNRAEQALTQHRLRERHRQQRRH